MVYGYAPQVISGIGACTCNTASTLPVKAALEYAVVGSERPSGVCLRLSAVEPGCLAEGQGLCGCFGFDWGHGLRPADDATWRSDCIYLGEGTTGPKPWEVP